MIPADRSQQELSVALAETVSGSKLGVTVRLVGQAARTASPNEPQGLRRGQPYLMAISLIWPPMASFSRWPVAPHFSQMALRWLLSLLSWATLLSLARCAIVNPDDVGSGVLARGVAIDSGGGTQEAEGAERADRLANGSTEG